MNRNSELHFAMNPTNIDIQRSKFKRDSQLKTTFSTGSLIPIYVDEVLPGDTFSIRQASTLRMTTPLYPVMDNANVDFYYFFVPNRLLWEHWKEFNGENTTTAWEQQVQYTIPQITAPALTGWSKGTIADYFGIPTQVPGISVSALPFRAYCLIWNEWFRDENLKDPCMVHTDDATTTGANTGNYITYAECGAEPLKVAKYHDYFTSALPDPQKGPDVLLPLGSTAEVITGDPHVSPGDSFEPINVGFSSGGVYSNYPSGNYGVAIGSVGDDKSTLADDGTTPGYVGAGKMTINNLYADLSNATASTINSLRQAFAVQRLFEKDARGGSRYTETLKAHFGVTSPDARQQRPEYLGGFRHHINIDQVIQTSSTGAISPQGHTAAYSLTNSVEDICSHSFTEHGLIVGLCCVRTDHTYQQGIERMWSRKDRFDYYWPSLANIGEQAILNKELYATGSSTDDEAFGYQEAWADYRYKPSHVTGAFRSNYATTLDAWHYADYYTSQPYLSSSWIDETVSNMDRTLSVSSAVEDQFIADFYFDVTCTRPMPLYSVPGLIDHH